MKKFKPCPFCGEMPRILVSDDEGNIHPDEYEKDPWSGLRYQIEHIASETAEPVCPIATFEGESIGTRIYDSREEATNAWNGRKG